MQVRVHLPAIRQRGRPCTDSMPCGMSDLSSRATGLGGHHARSCAGKCLRRMLSRVWQCLHSMLGRRELGLVGILREQMTHGQCQGQNYVHGIWDEVGNEEPLHKQAAAGAGSLGVELSWQSNPKACLLMAAADSPALHYPAD